jgi:hypothetical protein
MTKDSSSAEEGLIQIRLDHDLGVTCTSMAEFLITDSSTGERKWSTQP